MLRNQRQGTTDIKLNSVHLPWSVLAWQSPALLIILIVSGAVSIAVPSLLFFASPELKKAPVFSSAAQEAYDFYDRCMAHNRLARPDLSERSIHKFCWAEQTLYRQSLSK